MIDPDLAALRVAAEAADRWDGVTSFPSLRGLPNREHIGRANPAAVLALLDRLQRVEAALRLAEDERDEALALLAIPCPGLQSDEPIQVGDRFVWEPHLEHARAHVVVMAIETRPSGETWVQSADEHGQLYWSDESRFREACTRAALSPPKEARDDQ